MRHLYKNESERQECLKNDYGDNMVRTIMRKENLGEIPPGRKVIFLPEGDYDQGEMPQGMLSRPAGTASAAGGAAANTDPSRLTYRAGSSLIINLPPADESDPDGDEVLDYACSYIIWIPQPPSKKASSQKGD